MREGIATVLNCYINVTPNINELTNVVSEHLSVHLHP